MPSALDSLSPADLLRERLISSIDLSRDGERIAYSERTVVGGKDRSSLWIVPFGSGRPRRLTHGAWSDSSPRFSPDGRSLAFLSDREKSGVSQLLVLPLDGGDPKPLTTFKRGVSEAEWMPDGRSLAVVATDDESYDLHGERKGDETATVRVLRHVDWRMDGDGLLDHRRHVHVITLGGRSRRLTKGPWSAYHVRPHPGGTTDRLHRRPRRRRDPSRSAGARGRGQERPHPAALEAARRGARASRSTRTARRSASRSTATRPWTRTRRWSGAWPVTAPACC